jgi:hypothetical protein
MGKRGQHVLTAGGKGDDFFASVTTPVAFPIGRRTGLL